MPARYIPRSLEPVLRRAVREFPVVVLTGPRQSGKTTLLKRLFAETHEYVSLEPPDIRAAAAADPRGFVDSRPGPVIFDEVQYAPDLLAYVKEKVDAARDRPGRYLLTGSQNLLLLERVTESLAGRAAMLGLLPLSRREREGTPELPLPWEPGRAAAGRGGRGVPEKGSRVRGAGPPHGLWADLLRGGYPEIVADPERDARLWHASFVQTYLERDIRTLRQVGDLTQFQAFLRALAARSGQLLNLTDLARDLGVAVNTAKAWLSVLEVTYQVVVLRPYFANIGKRLVKTPKVYFTDPGILCYLTGLRDPEHAAAGPLAGAIVETAALGEILKTYRHRGIDPQIYFWRTATGTEVDFVVETERGLVPIEVKLTGTPRPAMAAGIASFRKDLGDRALPGFVVHTGEVDLPLGPHATALPFSDL